MEALKVCLEDPPVRTKDKALKVYWHSLIVAVTECVQGRGPEGAWTQL